ncbi:hypothetical protein ACHAWX_005794 [Stephanocyclus meneghinianus]
MIDPPSPFAASSVLEVSGESDVGMAPFNSRHDEITTDSFANNEQQWDDHSSFFTAKQQVRFWMASAIMAVVLHKLFLSRKKDLVGGNVVGSATPFTAVDDGKEPSKSNSLTSKVVETKEDRLDTYNKNLDDNTMPSDTSQHSQRDSNESDGKKSKSSSRGKQPKKLIHKDAASIRSYDKLVTTRTIKEDENLTLSTPPVDTKQVEMDETSPDVTTNVTTKHDTQQCNRHIIDVPIISFPLSGSLVDNEEACPSHQTIHLHTKPHHPGLKGYHYWQSTITSLYRIYSIPLYSYPNNSNNERGSSDNSFLKAILPMHPSSERGQVPVDIQVTNRTDHDVIHVFWMDYNGKEVYKGSMRRGETWNQTTYIGHPWIFRVDIGGGVDDGIGGVWNDGDEESVILKYVPFRVIPYILNAETVYHPSNRNFHGPVVGIQRFTLRSVPEGYGVLMDGQRWKPACVVEDAILPEPPLSLVRSGRRAKDPFAPECYDDWGHFHSNDPTQTEAYDTAIREIYTAIYWSCQQIQREEASSPGCGIAAVKRLRQYLSNVSTHPHEPKYRKLRIANPIFLQNVYNTGARGVLLALGFEEHCGYLECGASEGQMMTQDRIQMVSDAVAMLFMALDRIERQTESEMSVGGGVQPMGADGFGRAGFGYAGSMNRFL